MDLICNIKLQDNQNYWEIICSAKFRFISICASKQNFYLFRVGNCWGWDRILLGRAIRWTARVGCRQGRGWGSGRDRASGRSATPGTAAAAPSSARSAAGRFSWPTVRSWRRSAATPAAAGSPARGRPTTPDCPTATAAGTTSPSCPRSSSPATQFWELSHIKSHNKKFKKSHFFYDCLFTSLKTNSKFKLKKILLWVTKATLFLARY